jgi:hypothetical protein
MESLKSSVSFSPDTLTSKAKVGQNLIIKFKANGKTPVCTSSVSSKTSLPPGLTFDSMTLKGTPEKEGKYKFTIHVQCFGTNVSGDFGSHGYELEVLPENSTSKNIYTDQPVDLTWPPVLDFGEDIDTSFLDDLK